MKRILFPIYQNAPGGAERTVVYLSSYLADKGYEVYIVTSMKGTFYDIPENVHVKSLNLRKIPSTPFNKWAPRYFIRRCANWVKYKGGVFWTVHSASPDIVFGMLSGMCVSYLAYKRKGRIKLISSERSNPFYESDSVVETRKIIFDLCDKVIFQTERASMCYGEEIRAKSVIIPNAVGNNDIKDIVPCKDRKNYVCAIGRLSDEKNYPLLFKAFSIFRESHKDYNLLIYGEGVKKAQLMSLSEEMGLDQCIRFMGTDPKAVLKCSDASCYVLASDYEGMPNSLMEAMAAGIPCVSTDCPFGPAELIRDGENGLLVPVGDEIALSAAISRLVDDKELADKCSMNGRVLLETHSVEKQCELFEQAILQVVD